MNVKLITKALHTLSLLSEEDYRTVLELKALSEDEREQFRTALESQKQVVAPEKRKIERCEACNYTRRALQHINPAHTEYHEFVVAEKKPSKKLSTSKSSQSSTKSSRASGMAAQLNKTLKEQREAATKDGDEGFDMSRLCSKCAKLADNNIHHLESDPDYHLFIEYAPSESTAAGTGD